MSSILEYHWSWRSDLWINNLFLIVMVVKWQLWHRLNQQVLSLFNLMYIIHVYTCIIYNLCDNSTLCTWCKFALTTCLCDPLKMSQLLPSTIFHVSLFKPVSVLPFFSFIPLGALLMKMCVELKSQGWSNVYHLLLHGL